MEAMNEKTWPKAKYVRRRDGSLLTLGDLPPAKPARWVLSRKAIVVEAVRGGLLSVEDACWRYSLTLEEFFTWRAKVERRHSGASSAQRREDGQRLAHDAARREPEKAWRTGWDSNPREA